MSAHVFIDTNVFLDFYRFDNDAPLPLLAKLKASKDRLISPYQVGL